MLLIALGRFANILLIVLTIRIATTFLPPAEMARFFLISSAVALYTSILLNPVGMFVNRRFHTWNSKGLVSHFYNYFWLYLLFAAFIASTTIIIFVHANLLEFHTNLHWLVFLIFASMLISTANTMVIPGLNMLGKRSAFVYLTLATTAASMVAGFLMVTLIEPTTEYWLLGILVGQLLVAMLGARLFYKYIRQSHHISDAHMNMSRDHIGTLWKFAWPILIGAILIWVQSQSYRFMMENSIGLAQVGLFAAGYGISAGIIASLEAILTSYFQPIFYQNISSEDIVAQGKAWTNYAQAILQPLLPAGFLLVAAAPELTRLLLGANYEESSQFIVWGAIAELARVAYGVFGMAAHARMKTNRLLLPGFVGASISIAGTIWLMPNYGANGVGFALAFAGIAMVFVVYHKTRHELVMEMSSKTFFISILFGSVLIISSTIFRKMVEPESFLITFLFLFVLGCIFIAYQYFMFRPLVLEKSNG